MLNARSAILIMAVSRGVVSSDIFGFLELPMNASRPLVQAVGLLVCACLPVPVAH